MSQQSAMAASGGDRNSADWLLRIALAAVFIFHGVSKANGLYQGNPAPMGQSFEVWAAVTFGELAGGIGIIIGGLLRGWLGDIITRLSGVAIVPVMAGAIYMVHWGRWNFVPSDSHPMGGMEFQVVLLLMGLFFLLRGNRA